MWSLPHALSFLVLLVCLKVTCGKRAEFWQTKKVVLSCDRHGRVALVEHFFSLIFTEFRKNPPVCVCVQMCENQSTYCYPNGCLLIKSNEDNQDQTMHTPSTDYSENQQTSTREGTKPSLLTTKHVQQTSAANSIIKSPTEKTLARDLSSKQNDFEDTYKRIFKSKMSHKVGLRYVAESPKYVKNGYQGIRSFEPLDESKTHWPASQTQQKSTDASKPPIDEEAEKVKKFFLPTLNEEMDAEVLSQNFKRNTLMLNESGDSLENVSTSS